MAWVLPFLPPHYEQQGHRFGPSASSVREVLPSIRLAELRPQPLSRQAGRRRCTPPAVCRTPPVTVAPLASRSSARRAPRRSARRDLPRTPPQLRPSCVAPTAASSALREPPRPPPHLRPLDPLQRFTFRDIHTYRYVLAVAVVGCAYTLLHLPSMAVGVVARRKRAADGGGTKDDVRVALLLVFTDVAFALLLAAGAAAGLGFTHDVKRYFDGVVFRDDAAGSGSPEVDRLHQDVDRFFDIAYASAGLMLAAAACTTLVIMLSLRLFFYLALPPPPPTELCRRPRFASCAAPPPDSSCPHLCRFHLNHLRSFSSKLQPFFTGATSSPSFHRRRRAHHHR
ncbi:hypothetical protein BAE44_0003597 [Dichanthelium oligosanthes]|uniref:CASP-like protein n=1 Tax=Dichanthelium oligosanthes TaxID=888268 RepID=A0A1E5WD82_9POAL|nr:hypothetical protein BAE44_0003597 [Dichanthelium oligosanthes]